MEQHLFWYNLYMTIADALRTNKKIINREIVKLSELRVFVNELTGKEYTSTSIRNVFIGNGDYYKFNYKNIDRDIYVPNEFKGLEDVVKFIAKNNKWIPVGGTLEYKLGVSSQNNVKDEYVILTNEENGENSDILKSFDQLKITFLKPTIDFETFSNMLILKTIYKNKYVLKDFLKKSSLSIGGLIKIYSELNGKGDSAYKNFNGFNLEWAFSETYIFNKMVTDVEFLTDSNNTIEKALMQAIMEVANDGN